MGMAIMSLPIWNLGHPLWTPLVYEKKAQVWEKVMTVSVKRSIENSNTVNRNSANPEYILVHSLSSRTSSSLPRATSGPRQGHHAEQGGKTSAPFRSGWSFEGNHGPAKTDRFALTVQRKVFLNTV